MCNPIHKRWVQTCNLCGTCSHGFVDHSCGSAECEYDGDTELVVDIAGGKCNKYEEREFE